jgi:hypothetical protein
MMETHDPAAVPADNFGETANPFLHFSADRNHIMRHRRLSTTSSFVFICRTVFLTDAALQRQSRPPRFPPARCRLPI